MKVFRITLASVLIGLLAGVVMAQTRLTTDTAGGPQVWIAKRTTLAIKYPDHNSTSVNMVGTPLTPQAAGEARIKRKEGRTEVKAELENLPHPQSLGNYYTTYILWAIAPEGQAEKVAELPYIKKEIEATTTFQTFGLIVTAEPHGAVTLPSPVIVAENALRKGTDGSIEASRIEYRGDAGSFYTISTADAPPSNADYNTPLIILGARRAVEIAQRAGAQQHADAELRQAEIKLAALEQLWRRNRTKDERYNADARDVMRLAEHARQVTGQRTEQARLAAERHEASLTVARAQSDASQARSEADRARSDAERSKLEAERAQSDADRARREAEDARAALTRAQTEVSDARQRLSQAQTEADRAKANEDLARAEAEQARLQAEEARRERDAMQQRLFVSLSEILETRREARGLIVNLSDVLFDFNKASLKPGAREKLSKLAGILLAYPGAYRIEVEGHTDSVGSDDYNLKLSQDRAASVRDYLLGAGIAADRIIGTRGFGEMRPVATNDNDAGRQMNRRVELIISDTENRPVVNTPNNP